jgi:hypothetical protein
VVRFVPVGDLTILLTRSGSSATWDCRFSGARSIGVVQWYDDTRYQRHSPNSTCFVLEKRRDSSGILSPGSPAQSSSQPTPLTIPHSSTYYRHHLHPILTSPTDMAIIDTFKANTTSVEVLFLLIIHPSRECLITLFTVLLAR